MMESFLQDIRFGVRLLWKDKGVAITAIATLTLCIAANAAIFSVIHSVILKPLPVPEASRLLALYNSYPNVGVKKSSNGAADYYDRLRDVTVFEEIAMYNDSGVTLGEKGSVQRAKCLNVTPSFFRLLRSKPTLGRIFAPEEGEIGNERRVILSYPLWQELYGGDRSILGRDLRIYGNPYTIVGVMPKDFRYLDPEVRLWRPLAFTAEAKEGRHSNSWDMIGRLKPGATLEQAQAQVNALNTANLDRFPEFKQLLINAGFHTVVVPLRDNVVGDIKSTLYLLWGGVLFVLLIGAVNIANLALARSSARVKELATRFAMGASPWRVARQLMTESVLMTLISALFGLVLGYWGLRVFGTLGLNHIPRGSEIAMDIKVVFFILGLSLLVGFAVGAIPITHAFRTDLNTLFRGEGRTGTSSRGARLLRKTLVVAQVAFALLLLIGAGLLLASFRQVLAVKPGFVPQGVLTASIGMPKARYKGDNELRAFTGQALEKIRALPGVSAAGATDSIPFGDNSNDSVILAEGYSMRPGESLVSPSQIEVTPGYFEAMRIPLLDGRYFDERDNEKSPRVVIVDDRLAHKFWPNSSPIGKRMWQPSRAEDLVQPGKDVKWYTVVGVVKSSKQRALVDPDERVGAYFFPDSQAPQSVITLAILTAGNPNSLISAVRNAIFGLDAEIPIYDVHTMDERLEESLVTRKSPMLLSMGFGLVALVLAAVGIYGMLAYTVTLRTKEIGIRMALGGTTERIFKLILQEGILILIVGFVLGIAGTVALGRYVQSVLYGVRPLNPVVLASVTGVLSLVGVVACLVPARRAARIDPVAALREE
ncbi:MAG: ABC transporter permease [Acidobacteriia bacterium]|nr:ABC transporter permease [Terriglobia bacterium]